MKICVLLPDYSTTRVDYQYYDPPRDLSPLMPGAEIDTVLLNKLTTYKQLKELSHKGYDIFVNLCEGYLEWEVPSIDVIHYLDLLGLPYTGPVAELYDPAKALMKYVAWCEGVKTPASVIIRSEKDCRKAHAGLHYPLFVKPAKAGDSLGIDDYSKVNNRKELEAKVSSLLPEYDELLVEEFIDGREFTVLVAANARPENTCTVYRPLEYVFPAGRSFKTYALKTSELHPDCNHPCTDPELDAALRDAAERIFNAFKGKGYARLDFRVNEKKEVYFLEINFTCSVFYTDGYEGSADYILKYDGTGQAGFLQHIIEEGMARHQARRKKYTLAQNSISGYGIYANATIRPGEIVFHGEERPQRLVTKRFVEENWNAEEKEYFRRYAYPVSSEVYILWDNNPTEWAPQNHSCNANTEYQGLNVVATRTISKGEELTLNYANFLDESAEGFVCTCGAANCRGLIQGAAGNSVTAREKRRVIRH